MSFWRNDPPARYVTIHGEKASTVVDFRAVRAIVCSIEKLTMEFVMDGACVRVDYREGQEMQRAFTAIKQAFIDYGMRGAG